LGKLLREFASKNVKVITAPLHLSNGGIAQYQGQCCCIISSFDSIREKRFTLSFLLDGLSRLGYNTEKISVSDTDSFGSLLRQKEVGK